MWKSIKLMLATCCAVLVAGTFGAFAQNGGETSVKGIVKDAAGPIVGATVITQDGTSGTTTAMDGSFTLNKVKEGDVIVISFIGYQTQEIPYVGQTMLDVTLKEEATALNAVVVTALGIKREEKALSYNVQQVKSDEITTVKDANFMNSLVGKVAGVTINAGAGGAGTSSRVIMRGMKSLEKSNAALYVIDGIPMYNNSFGGDAGGTMTAQVGSESIADINPEDIESINMLTGPSAAALYGSDAANGVVLINTKRGAEGKTTVTISNTTMFSKAYMMPEMQNRYGTSNTTFSWGDKINGTFDAKDFFNTGTNVINSVSLSTGTQKNQTYISVSTTNAADIIPEAEYNRYNFTARNTTKFAKDKLTFDFGASFVIQNNQNQVSQGKYYNPLPALYLFPRGDDFDEIRLYERWDPVRGYMAQYWPYGEGAHSLQNPYWIQNRIMRETTKRRYMLNASLKWDITDWLDVTGRVRIDNSDYRITTKYYASTLETFAGENGGLSDETQLDRTFYGDVMANINKTWGDWSLSVMGNYSFNRNKVLEDDSTAAYPWQSTIGNKVGQRFGLVALGLFESKEEIAASPVQTGDTRPGDIKYKDINGDGLINEYDEVPIGWGNVPEIIYGVGFSVGWKNLSLTAMFQGAAHVDAMLSGEGVLPFAQGSGRGNLLSNITDRWTEQNPRQDAFYPRLSIGTINMNYEKSTWWLKNTSYLRLKNVELSYTLPDRWMKHIRLENARIFIQGVNLLTFSPFDIWDVELGDGRGAAYPNISSASLGLSFNF